MNVREKMLLDRLGLIENGPINIVILGDSVSHGALLDNIDYENVYWNILKKRLNAFRDYVPVNMINASIGGTTAKDAVGRMEKQAFSHNPDLMIVCFGLNDVMGPLEEYLDSLSKIFDRCNETQCEAIFLTPNMLNTYVAADAPQTHLDYARRTAEVQNSGRMDTYIYSAVALAQRKGIAVCDCYSRWKALAKTEDTTMLLANRINHPVSEMHKLFADALYQMIMGEGVCEAKEESTMYTGA